MRTSECRFGVLSRRAGWPLVCLLTEAGTRVLGPPWIATDEPDRRIRMASGFLPTPFQGSGGREAETDGRLDLDPPGKCNQGFDSCAWFAHPLSPDRAMTDGPRMLHVRSCGPRLPTTVMICDSPDRGPDASVSTSRWQIVSRYDPTPAPPRGEGSPSRSSRSCQPAVATRPASPRSLSLQRGGESRRQSTFDLDDQHQGGVCY